MSPWTRALVAPVCLGVVVAFSTGCGSTQTEPVENEPAPIDPADGSPAPDPSPADAAAPEPSAPVEVSFHQVVHHTMAECDVSPVTGGAVILCGSFVAMVSGDEIRQDAAWLTGMTEVMAWLPERLELEFQPPPAAVAGPDLALPIGAVLEVSTGNRHGPAITQRWGARAWATVAEGRAGDPRVAASPGEAFLCTRGQHVVRYRGGARSPMEPTEGTIESCAATADGTLWVTTDDYELFRSTPPGRWERVPGPDRRRVQKVAASGERLWVVSIGSTDEGGGTFVYSSAPVNRPVEIGYNQTPFAPSGGIIGLDDVRIDVPSVGASPPGPGTSACSSLVLYLGRKLSPATRTKLGRTAAGAKLEVVQVAGTATGTMEWPEGDGAASIVPSTRKSLAVAVVPSSYDEGQRLVDLLVPNPDPFEMPENAGATQPRLLCAIPRVEKILGPVGDRRIDLRGRPCPVTPYEADDPCPGYKNYAGQLPQRP